MLAEVGDADAVVFVGGISPNLEGEQLEIEEPGFKGGDRTDLELPKAQRQVIAMLHQASVSSLSTVRDVPSPWFLRQRMPRRFFRHGILVSGVVRL